MGGRPQKREKASGRKGVGTRFRVPRETDSRWDTVPIGCVQGLTLERVYADRVYVGPRLRVYVGRVGRGYGWTRLRLDAVTLRGC